MKWCRFWMKSDHTDIQDYLELPDEVAGSPRLLKIEFDHWFAVLALSVETAGCKKGHEFTNRPPVGWLIDKAHSLKEEAKNLAEQAKRYNALAADKGGRREDTAVKWVAGSLFSEQRRSAPDRRKGKK